MGTQNELKVRVGSFLRQEKSPSWSYYQGTVFFPYIPWYTVGRRDTLSQPAAVERCRVTCWRWVLEAIPWPSYGHPIYMCNLFMGVRRSVLWGSACVLVARRSDVGISWASHGYAGGGPRGGRCCWREKHSTRMGVFWWAYIHLYVPGYIPEYILEYIPGYISGYLLEYLPEYDQPSQIWFPGILGYPQSISLVYIVLHPTWR